MSKKNILKKICAMMIAIVTIITGTAGAVKTADAAWVDVGTVVFQEPGVDVFGDGRHSGFAVKFIEGQHAFCIEYGIEMGNMSIYYPTTQTNVTLGPLQQRQLAYALAYGYSPASVAINTAENRAKFAMTQTLIWCITEKHWGDETAMNAARDRVASALHSAYGTISVKYSQDYFNQLRKDMTLAMDRVAPSFTSIINDSSVPTITLNWNSANGRYQRTLTDTNGVLSAFDFSSLSASGIGYEISGNNIIFYTSASNAGMTTPALTVNPAEGSYAAQHCSTSVVYWGEGNGQVVATRTMQPDPVKAYVRFNTQTETLRIKKVSSDNGEPLNNVTFDIYKDAACTSLVKSVVTQTIGEEIGVADVTGLGVGLTYYIKERAGAGATNHQLLKAPVSVTIKSSDNVITISNNRVPVTIELTKTDEKTGAGVAGAVYSLYARENIKAAAGDTVLFEACSWVADFPETDVNGKATLENLYIGKYYVKEKSAPPSGEYLLDTKEYEVDASANSKDFASDAVIRVNVSVVEKRSPGLIKIEKTDSETGEKLSGAEFGIYSDKDCTKLIQTLVTDENGAAVSETLNEGTYYVKELKAPAGYVADVTVHSADVAPAKATVVKAENDPITVTITKTSVTGDCPEIPGATLVIKDSEGNEVESWVSTTEPHMIERLPAGTYTLTELRTPFGYQVAETVEFTVLDTNEIQTVTMVDAETYGKVIINKTDEATDEPLAGVEFEARVAEDVLDAECNVAITAGTVADTLVTDENGHAESKLLPIGTYGTEGWTSYIKYELVETETLEGYVLDDTVYEVKFEYMDDKTPVIEKTFDITNDFTKVQITKTSVTVDCPEVPGATLVIKDSEGNEVESWVSTTEPHMIERLPVGTYTLTELRTPFGYQVAETVEFTVEETREIQTVVMIDAETYGKVAINKTDEETDEPLEGVEFEVRYAEDVLDAEGSVVIVTGTVADVLITDENGYAESKLLPIGTYGTEGWTSYIKYELVETETLEGYVLDDTVHEIEFEYIDDKTPVIEKTFDITNDFTKVQITKTSVTGDCPEVPGATLVIKDSEGNEVESWVSTTEPHMIERLPAGTYTLTELRTPFGYQVAETVEFTVLETGEIQTVTMIDAETYGKVIINKTDEKTGKALKGVTFEMRYAEDVLDSEGSVVIEAGTVADTLVTDENGYAESDLFPIGTYGTEGWTSYIQYKLVEVDAADGYVLDKTEYIFQFEYVDDKTPVIEKVFDVTNELVPVEPPKTGDTTHAPFWLVIALMAVAGTVVGVFARKKQFCKE